MVSEKIKGVFKPEQGKDGAPSLSYEDMVRYYTQPADEPTEERPEEALSSPPSADEGPSMGESEPPPVVDHEQPMTSDDPLATAQIRIPSNIQDLVLEEEPEPEAIDQQPDTLGQAMLAREFADDAGEQVVTEVEELLTKEALAPAFSAGKDGQARTAVQTEPTRDRQAAQDALQAELVQAREELERLKSTVLQSAQEESDRVQKTALEALQSETEQAQQALARTQECLLASLQAEIEEARQGAARQVRAELTTGKPARRQDALVATADMAETFYESWRELLRMEIDVLRREGERILADEGTPIAERAQVFDWIFDRLDKDEQRLTQVQEQAAQRAIEAMQEIVVLEDLDPVARMRQELERQDVALKELSARVGQQGAVELPAGLPELVRREVEAAAPNRGGRRIGLVPVLLALLVATALGTAGIMLPRQENSTAGILVEMAVMRQAAGEKEDMIRALDEAMAAGIDDPEALGRVGEMYRVAMETDKAIEALEQAVDRDDQTASYRVSLARAYGDAGRNQEAVDQYQVLIAREPENAWYHAYLGHARKRMQDYDAALAEYGKMIELNTDAWAAYIFMAELYLHTSQPGEAAASYEKTLELMPDHYDARVSCGRTYVEIKEYQKAADHFQAATVVAPTRAEAYYHLGDVRLIQGSLDQAATAYDQAIQRNNNHVEAYVGLGKVRVLQDDCENAVSSFTTALKLEPQNVQALEGMSACRGS